MDTVQQAMKFVEPSFDWTPFMWLSGVIGSLFLLLLSSIAYLLQSSKQQSIDAINDFRAAWGKHDDRMNKQQEEIHTNSMEIKELSLRVKAQSELMKVEQEQGWKRIELLEKKIFKE